MKGVNFFNFLNQKINNLKSSIFQKETTLSISQKNSEIITRNNFEFQYVIGKGGFGKVKYILINKYNM